MEWERGYFNFIFSHQEGLYGNLVLSTVLLPFSSSSWAFSALRTVNKHASFPDHSTRATAPSSQSCQHILYGNSNNNENFIQVATYVACMQCFFFPRD